MAQLWLGVCMSVTLCLKASLGLPPQHRGWLRLWEEGEACGECRLHLCPPAPGACPAGLTSDRCGCCEQCANVEGQRCDPDGAQTFYGSCGAALVCLRRTARQGRDNMADPEPVCVCRDEGPVCGSDGWTYANLCQLREAASRDGTTLEASGMGPCHSAPRVLRAPKDLVGYVGSGAVLGCEVTASPLPNTHWRKRGADHFLPGDHPHVSVQVRGGPQRYSVSTWLQIEALQLSDAGVYSCISLNALGETWASARLTVLITKGQGAEKRFGEEEELHVVRTEEGGEDGETGSGDFLG